MTQREPRDDATNRAAALIAQALSELQQQQASQVSDTRQEISSSRAVLQDLSTKIEKHLTEEREQHVALGGQLSTLAGSLDRLVNHLQGLSTLMSDLLERIAEPAPVLTGASQTTPPASAEPSFQPGGEGVSLLVTGVPGFQALMDIQKSLTAMHQVAHASVERFQEGDSRLLVGLTASITASDLVAALIRGTGQAMTVEESKPELARLKIKVIPGA